MKVYLLDGPKAGLTGDLTPLVRFSDGALRPLPLDGAEPGQVFVGVAGLSTETGGWLIHEYRNFWINPLSTWGLFHYVGDFPLEKYKS